MLPVARLIGHKEWTRRKSDPRHDMNWRRGRVAAFTPRTPTPLQEDHVPFIITAANRPKAVLAEGFFIAMDEASDEPKNWAAAGAREVWVTPAVWDRYHAAQNRATAVLEQIAAKPAAAAGAVTIDVPDGFAAQLADAVNDEDDRRDRDGDPATGPVS